MKKRLQVLTLCIISLYGLLSCGLEEFYYIEFIPNVIQTDNTFVRIRLPADGRPGYGSTEYFNNFIVFYRIYLSNANEPSMLPDNFSSINPTMNSNYIGLDRYTDTTSTTVSSENLENIFFSSTFNFFKLALEERNIDDVLSRNSLGTTLRFYFPGNPGVPPSLDITRSNNTTESFNLLRATTDKLGTLLKTMPDDSTDNYRCFMNFDEIRNPAFAPPVTNESNADVAIRTGEADTINSYVLFYIAAQGMTREMPPRPIYSQPTYIGIFRLPNAN